MYVTIHIYVCVFMFPRPPLDLSPRVAESESLGNGAWDSAW